MGKEIFSTVSNHINGTNDALDESSCLKKMRLQDVVTGQNEENIRILLQKVFNMMVTYVKKSMDRSERILEFHQPEELKQQVDLHIPENGLSLHDLLKDCESMMKYTVRTGHPRFFNQISQGLEISSLIGEWIAATTNTNMFTYEVAPLYTLMEEATLIKMRQIIGWNEPGDGIYSPGGSISNLYAVQIAKHFHFPELKYEGLFNHKKLVYFTSAHCHYSVLKAGAILGIGLKQVREVPVDERGKLIPEKLEQMILESLEAQEMPFMVVLTCGTTVLGAFDPIEPVANMCAKYKLWLHIDAAWGGGVLLSQKYKHLMKGIEKADSVTWNPHKLMGVHLQASAFLTKHPNLLLSCNEMSASYLFQQDKHYDVHFDTGDKTIQCGRHVDICKMWLMWRSKGLNGFEEKVNKLMELAQYLYEQLKKRQNYEIVLQNPEFTNICFWYVPRRLKNMDKTSFEYKVQLNEVAPKIKAKMMDDGCLMIGYQPLDDKPNFFRMIVSNSASERSDIDFLLDKVEEYGKDL